MKKEDVLIVKLNPKFQNKIFQKLINKYGGSIKASPIINIPAASIRGYKNLYFDSIPKSLINKLIKLKIINSRELEKNISEIFNKKDKIKEILDKGRQTRFKQLRKWKNDIPKLSKILINNCIDFEKWFLSYRKLINFGARKFNYIKQKQNYLEVSYITHSNKNKKEFILKFPRTIRIDKDFMYFFGLWVGDKAGGKRFGIMNKNKTIISFSKKYLKKLYQNPEVVLYIAKNEKAPNEKFDKIVKINNKEKGYAFSVHITNGILVSFFYYLESNLNKILYNRRDFNIFFAGLFDAEGNVSLEDSCFRWSCKNDNLKKIFETHLKRLNLFDRYDGSNFVTYNKKQFEKIILPYLIHPIKINNTNLVCFNKGCLDKRFNNILNIIKKNEGITNKELSKALKKKKVYAQVGVLEKLGYIYSKNYPKQMFINKLSGGN